MKTLLVSLFTALFSFLFGQDGGIKLPILTYNHGVKLNQIPEPGNEYIFKQFCVPETVLDSVISSGNIKFKGSKIGKIKDCICQWQIRDDTLKKIIIETNQKKYTAQAITQATDQFGNPTKVWNNDTTTYIWNIQTQKTNYIAQLIVAKDQETGIMTITK